MIVECPFCGAPPERLELIITSDRRRAVFHGFRCLECQREFDHHGRLGTFDDLHSGRIKPG